MDIRRWLEQHDLGKYAEVFIEHEVQLGDLPELTEDDLGQLGLPLGPRRRALRAIRELELSRVDDGTEVGDYRVERSDEPQAAWSRHPDDRRPVTLLFADLTGSTALTEQLDPEDAHKVLYGAVRRMGDAVEANRGTVCRFMGDGLMAMFGVPTAFESHAREACFSALALQASIEAYSKELERDFGVPLQARVGLHAGEVVALQVGEGDRVEWDASGPAVPIAARLEQNAEPGTIQMTESTFELVGTHFEGTPLESVSVKGVSTPLSVVRLEHAVESNTAIGSAHTTLFIGRRTERSQMLAALETCLDEGCGQTLFVRGEAGVGKTRLVHEVVREAEAFGFALHRTLVLDFGAGKGQAPVPALARSLLELPPSSDKNARTLAAETALASGLVTEPETMFLHDLLDLPQPAHLAREFEAMDPDLRRRRRRDMFRDLAVRKSRTQPCLLVVEDMHWADDVTLDFLRALMEASTEVPLALLMTARPSLDPLTGEWQSAASGSPLTVISLRPLRQTESERLAAEFDELDNTTVAACIERSGGNPLFLVELLRASRRGLGGSLPTSVQTIAATRLDALEPTDREAAQAAAVLGQRFELEMLQGMVGRSDYEPSALLDAELIRPEGEGFLFTHALVMEGVLASLLRDQRKDLHARAAEWFSTRDLTLTARHLERAESPDAPLAYFDAAKEQVVRFRFAVANELAHDGLRLASEPTHKASLHELLGQSQMGLGRSRAAADAFTEALVDAHDTEQRRQLLIALAHASRNHGEYDAGMLALDEAERIATSLEDKCRIENLRGRLYLSLLNPIKLERSFAKALEYAREAGSLELEALVLGSLASVTLVIGRQDHLRRHMQRCLEICQQEDLLHIEAEFIHVAGFGAMWYCELGNLRRYCEASVEKTTKVGAMRAAQMAHEGLCLAGLWGGDLPYAREHIEEALRLAELTGEKFQLPFHQHLMGLVMVAEGHHAEANSYLRDALAADVAGDARLPLLGALAVASTDSNERHDVLVQGNKMVATSPFGAYKLHYCLPAMDALIDGEDWLGLERQAELLESSLEVVPPLASLMLERARLLARFGQGDHGAEVIERMGSLKGELEVAGLLAPVSRLSAALSQQ